MKVKYNLNKININWNLSNVAYHLKYLILLIKLTKMWKGNVDFKLNFSALHLFYPLIDK